MLLLLGAAALGWAQEQNTGSITGRIESPLIRKTQAVVYVERIEGKKFALLSKNPVLDQKDLVFVPHVLPVLVGSTVDFPNSDQVRHNLFSPAKSSKPFNLGTYPVGEVKQMTFDKEGIVPLLCNVHAEMWAYIVVLQNPCFATTNEKGEFTIQNVPSGEYNLTFWHEDIKPSSKKVSVTAQQATEVVFGKP